MRIVVTGALGHIGSRFIRGIPTAIKDTEILLVDDLSTQRYCSLFDLPAGGCYRFVEADVLTEDLVPLFDGARAVVHMAAVTNAAESFVIQERVEEVNLKGTQKVAQACATTGSPLIFLSTTSVYGTQRAVVNEECPESELKPQSPYAESKLKAERYLRSLGASDGLRFIVCRFGTIFGTSIGMRFHTAVNKFCWQAVMGRPLTVWRTAMNQKRPYLDLRDAVDALGFIIEKDLFDSRVYNILTTNATVKSIVEIIASLVPNLSVEYVEAQIMNQLSYEVSNERFKSLGFQCQGSLEQGIADTIRLLEGVHQR